MIDRIFIVASWQRTVADSHSAMRYGLLMERVVEVQSHDDGINSWSFARTGAAGRLTGLIDGYCDYAERTAGFTTRRELPHAEGVLIINLGQPTRITGGDGAIITLNAGDGFVAGVHLRPALSHSDGAQAGVQVALPLATVGRLLAVPMHELRDRVVKLDDIAGRATRALSDQLADAHDRAARFACLDRWLFERLGAVAAPAPAATHALHLLRHRRDLDIAEIARIVGWSRRHLARAIERTIGIGPRSFRRLLRFQEATRLASPNRTGWAAIAAQAGYADQAHLVREFREFAGLTPTAFAARQLEDGGGVIEA